MSMVPTTEQRIAALEAEAGRLRRERDEARGLAKRFMLERNHLIEGIRDSIVALGLRSGALNPIDLARTVLTDLLDSVEGDGREGMVVNDLKRAIHKLRLTLDAGNVDDLTVLFTADLRVRSLRKKIAALEDATEGCGRE